MIFFVLSTLGCGSQHSRVPMPGNSPTTPMNIVMPQPPASCTAEFGVELSPGSALRGKTEPGVLIADRTAECWVDANHVWFRLDPGAGPELNCPYDSISVALAAGVEASGVPGRWFERVALPAVELEDGRRTIPFAEHSCPEVYPGPEMPPGISR